MALTHDRQGGLIIYKWNTESVLLAAFRDVAYPFQVTPLIAKTRGLKLPREELGGGSGSRQAAVDAFLRLSGGSSALVMRTLLCCLSQRKQDVNQPNHILYKDYTKSVLLSPASVSSFRTSERITVTIAVVKSLSH